MGINRIFKRNRIEQVTGRRKSPGKPKAVLSQIMDEEKQTRDILKKQAEEKKKRRKGNEHI